MGDSLDTWGVAPAAGGHIGAPERLRGSVGFFVLKKNDNPYGSPGVGMSFEPGLSGGRLSVAAGHFSYIGSTVGRLTLLRTWDDPWTAEPNQTYLGIEGQTAILPLSALRVGIFQNTDDSSDWLWSWSVGVGF